MTIHTLQDQPSDDGKAEPPWFRIGQEPKWPHGEAVKAELLAACGFDKALAQIAGLAQRVCTMGIASRFRRDRYPGQVFDADEGTPKMSWVDLIHGNGHKLNEAGALRYSFLIRLQHLFDEFILISGELGRLREEIEVANMEPSGERAPQMACEEREASDYFSPSNKA